MYYTFYIFEYLFISIDLLPSKGSRVMGGLIACKRMKRERESTSYTISPSLPLHTHLCLFFCFCLCCAHFLLTKNDVFPTLRTNCSLFDYLLFIERFASSSTCDDVGEEWYEHKPCHTERPSSTTSLFSQFAMEFDAREGGNDVE